MPSFRRQTTTESPLKGRVRDAAVEAARESQQRIIEAAREVAEQAPERAQQLRAAVAEAGRPLGALGTGAMGAGALHAVRDESDPRPLRGAAGDRLREAAAAQGPGDPGRQPREPHGHADHPLGAAAPACASARPWRLPPTTSTATGSPPGSPRCCSTPCPSTARAAAAEPRAPATSTSCSTTAGTCCCTPRAAVSTPTARVA